ncbi:MAG: MBL fold metallo-hydrolase [Spirochaetota bacterium]
MEKKFIIILVGSILAILGLFLLKPYIVDKVLVYQVETLGNRFRYDLLRDGKLHVITVGTGTPIANPQRVQSATAILVDGVFIMLDAGAGAAEQADLQGLPLSELNAVFLTHLHSDHIADLPLLASKGWRYGRKIPVLVYGPIGTFAVVEGFNKAYSFDKKYRYENIKSYALPIAKAEPNGYDITTPPTEKQLVHTFPNGLKVYAFAVEHAPVEHAFGFRIEYKGRSVVISGDTKFSKNMIRHSQQVDLLIHEANNFALLDHLIKLIGNTDNKTLQAFQVLGKKIQKYHTSPLQAAKIASQAKAKKLVFTHIDPPMGPYYIRKLITEPFFLSGVSDVYSGETVIAEDGMEFKFDLE